MRPLALMFILSLMQPLNRCQAAAIRVSIALNTFASLDRSWSSRRDVSSENKRVILGLPPHPPAIYISQVLYPSRVDDVTVCAAFNVISTTDPALTLAGIAFWGTDDNAYHLFAISPVGTYQVIRKISADRVAHPLAPKSSSLVPTAPDRSTELKVQLKGTQAILSINDTQVAVMKAPAASRNHRVGFAWALPGFADSRYAVARCGHAHSSQ